MPADTPGPLIPTWAPRMEGEEPKPMPPTLSAPKIKPSQVSMSHRTPPSHQLV